MKRRSLMDRAAEAAYKLYPRPSEVSTVTPVMRLAERIAYARGYVAGWKAARRDRRRQ